MSLTAKEGGSGDFELCPEDTHLARGYKVIDLGTQHSEMFDKDTMKVMIAWELPEALMTDGRPFSVTKWYTISLHEKANLRRDLEAWRGKGFTKEELEGFDLKNVLGVPCYITIAHEEKNGKIRDVIKSLMKLPKGVECPEAVNDPIYLSLDVEEFDRGVFNDLSDGLKDIIRKSLEWKALEKGGSDEANEEAGTESGTNGEGESATPF